MTQFETLVPAQKLYAQHVDETKRTVGEGGEKTLVKLPVSQGAVAESERSEKEEKA